MVDVRGLDDRRLQRLYTSAKAGRWSLSASVFRDALAASLEKAFAEHPPSAREADRYLRGLHLEDLALACACIDGNEAAWEHLVREYRPALHRAADAIDPTGRARELADALYADLFGMVEDHGRRRSLLRYFHGRSSLATWLRSVLAQRHVDALRAARRFDPLSEEPSAEPVAPSSPDPDRPRLLLLLQRAIDAAIAQLEPRDRLRLACYYAQQLTLADIGRVLHEHEATVSRHLARTRHVIRHTVERRLEEDGLDTAEVRRCLQMAIDDPGPLDLGSALTSPGGRKIGEADRSKQGTP
jgi:RNA polymerase sigma-70 factor (ECF subfamily)